MDSGNYSAADEALEMALILDTTTGPNPERAALLISYLDRYVDGSLSSERAPVEYLLSGYNRILERCEQTDFFKDASLVDSISLFHQLVQPGY